MSLAQIKRFENSPRFRSFLIKYGLKSYSEYLDLFWNDKEKREETVKVYLKEYCITPFNF